MFPGTTNRAAVTLICAACVAAGASAWAVEGIPEKGTWKLRNGASFDGRAHDFGYQLCLVQRRFGKVYVNGAEVTNAGTRALLACLAMHYSVPMHDPKALQKHLATAPFAQLVMPYFTLKYDADGVEQQVPVALLAEEEIASLRPSFNAWCQQKQREHEERVFRAQQLENEQARLAMQAEELSVQRSIEAATWNQAFAARQSADSLRQIEVNTRKR